MVITPMDVRKRGDIVGEGSLVGLFERAVFSRGMRELLSRGMASPGGISDEWDVDLHGIVRNSTVAGGEGS